MNTYNRARFQRGSTLSTILLMILLGSVGYFCSVYVIEWSGDGLFIKAVPFFAAFMVICLTPLYPLHRQISDLKKIVELTPTERGRVDYVVEKRTSYLICIAVFYIFSAAFMISSRMWPVASELSLLLAKLSAGVVVIGFWFAVQTLLGVREVDKFEALLERRSQKAEERKRLLKKMSAE